MDIPAAMAFQYEKPGAGETVQPGESKIDKMRLDLDVVGNDQGGKTCFNSVGGLGSAII